MSDKRIGITGDETGDTTGDDTGDIIWMSYAELGQRRGISAASAKRLAIRRQWRRHRGNDGTARVAVPVTELRVPDAITGDVPSDITPAIRAFETALAALRSAKDDQITLLREELAKERGRIADLITQIGDLETRLHHESRVAREALEAVDHFRQADAERRGRGRLRRLRAAWRGE